MSFLRQGKTLSWSIHGQNTLTSKSRSRQEVSPILNAHCYQFGLWPDADVLTRLYVQAWTDSLRHRRGGSNKPQLTLSSASSIFYYDRICLRESTTHWRHIINCVICLGENVYKLSHFNHRFYKNMSSSTNNTVSEPRYVFSFFIGLSSHLSYFTLAVRSPVNATLLKVLPSRLSETSPVLHHGKNLERKNTLQERQSTMQPRPRDMLMVV